MNEISRPIEVITNEIQFYTQQAGMSIIEIGKRLHEAKLCLPHGAWGDWLKNEVHFSERTAQNFMRIAREYQNPQLLADMGNSATKALLLLSLPAEEREAFVAEAHEINGEAKTVAEMSTKEMEELTKALAAERAEREKLQTQMELFRMETEREKDAVLLGAEQKIESLAAAQKAAEQAQQAAEERITAMQAEMDELRMQAEQVALPDETELEKLRAEAEKKAQDAMQKKLKKAKADAEKYRREAKEAQAAIEAHEQAQKEAEEAALAARTELARTKADAEKRVRANASSVVAVFRVRFDAVQMELDQLRDCIRQAEENGQTEDAVRLRKALRALCEKVLEEENR